ncbi:MAG: hypothetical protein ACOX4J_04205 [Anaerovoracaceae bacterium]
MEHTTCPVPKKMKLLITILNMDDGEEIAAFYRDHGITFNMIAPAYGAAGLEIKDYLGLTNTEKDLVISIADEDKIQEILPKIREFKDLDKPNTGIAFTIPLVGISGPKALRYVSGYDERSDKNEP